MTEKKVNAESAPRFLRAFDFLPDGEQKNTALLAMIRSGTAPKTVSSDLLQRVSKTSLKDSPEVKKAMDRHRKRVANAPE